ncbi:EcsC family protein [Antrihabitans spumae]|uniref:EcsC family protein n=1 Tax=Antrihabitans spumae TaxID=3373370 RepID=A0ABW7KUB5_9NOCA
MNDEANAVPNDGALQARADVLVDKILAAGMLGVGPWKGAKQIADEALQTSNSQDEAIKRLIATHRRQVGVSGFVTSVGGPISLVVGMPADIVSFYAAAVRVTAAIAYTRGYNLDTEEVKSVVLVSLLGAGGAAAIGEAGAKIGTKSAIAAIQRVPGRVLIDINKKVGFRLVTKFGQRGAINLVKIVPLVGGGVGAGVNVVGLNTIAKYAKSNFPDRLVEEPISEP